MYLVTTAKQKDLVELMEDGLRLDLDMNKPVFIYVLKEDEELKGYSVLQFEDGRCFMNTFEIKEKNPQLKLFFIKSIGNKLYEMGLREFLLPMDSDFTHSSISVLGTRKIVNINKLFESHCGGQNENKVST